MSEIKELIPGLKEYFVVEIMNYLEQIERRLAPHEISNVANDLMDGGGVNIVVNSKDGRDLMLNMKLLVKLVTKALKKHDISPEDRKRVMNLLTNLEDIASRIKKHFMKENELKSLLGDFKSLEGILDQVKAIGNLPL